MSFYRVCAAALASSLLVVTATQAAVPRCGPVVAKMVMQYELHVMSFGFVPLDPQNTLVLRELVARGTGLSRQGFRKRFPGPYFDWFGDQIVDAYVKKRKDYLKVSGDIRASCAIRFPESDE